MSDAQDWVTFLLALATLLGVLIGWLHLVHPRILRGRSEVTAIRDSILGRDAIVDSITGREIEPALPGVGVRLAATEEHLGVLAESVASLVLMHERIDRVEMHDKVQDGRIDKLEEASVERIVSRAESAAGWRAMEEAIKAEPDVVVDDRPDPPMSR